MNLEQHNNRWHNLDRPVTTERMIARTVKEYFEETFEEIDDWLVGFKDTKDYDPANVTVRHLAFMLEDLETNLMTQLADPIDMDAIHTGFSLGCPSCTETVMSMDNSEDYDEIAESHGYVDETTGDSDA